MIHFRDATIQDARLLYDWRNAPHTREHSFDSSPLVWEDHLSWMKGKFDSGSSHIFILYNELNAPVGQIRFDYNDKKEAVIDISIDVKYRNQGYATEGLKKTVAFVLQQERVKKLLAYIKKENNASYKTFLRAGFTLIKEVKVKLYDCYLLEFACL